jgi:gliding motility-associated-like protein
MHAHRDIPGYGQAWCIDHNPNKYVVTEVFWYRITCYRSGTFNFLIEYNDPLDDYAWQVFDITGRNPDDVYIDSNLTVIGNWGYTDGGSTGTKPNAITVYACALPTPPAFNYAPEMEEGHTYLLLVAHTSQRLQGGYRITFDANTGRLISDQEMPVFSTARTACAATQIKVKLSKKILCSSIAPDGSDFMLNASTISVIGASGGCTDRFETDSITLTLSRGLQEGNYILFVKNGADNNTLLSTCTVPIEPNTAISFDLAGDTKAAFAAPLYGCPSDAVAFTDSSTGNIISWHWDFKNGQTSSDQSPPPQTYQPVTADREVEVSLAIRDADNCTDTAYRTLKLIYNCYIAVPSAFTPNGDGRNDFLYPLNAYKATQLKFRVYDRWGQLLFITNDWTRKWDGTVGGKRMTQGVYVWMLDYTDDKNNRISKKGTTMLIW